MSDTPTFRRQAISDAEWRLVIDTLRQHGPDSAKAVLARGQTQGDGRPARRTTLNDVLKRDPIRRAQWEDAEREFLTQFVKVMHESAVTPEVIKEYDRKTGRLVRERISRRDMNWAALMVLRRYDPAWRDRKAVEVNGQIQHDHTHQLGSPTGFVLNPEEIALLPAEKAQQLLELLYEVEALKLENESGPTRELIDQPARALPSPQQQGEPDPDAPPPGLGSDGG
jgi:hypothetical protein